MRTTKLRWRMLSMMLCVSFAVAEAADDDVGGDAASENGGTLVKSKAGAGKSQRENPPKGMYRATNNHEERDASSTVTSTNLPPSALASAAPTFGVVPVTVLLDGGASNDPDGTIKSYAWDLGDGMTASGITVVHTYILSGTYAVALTVTDNQGATRTDTLEILVKEPPASCVAGIDMSAQLAHTSKTKSRTATAAVRVVDRDGAAVGGATVSGVWGGVVDGVSSGVTDANGRATLHSSKTEVQTGTFTFRVSDVSHATLPYDTTLNGESRDSITFGE